MASRPTILRHLVQGFKALPMPHVLRTWFHRALMALVPGLYKRAAAVASANEPPILGYPPLPAHYQEPIWLADIADSLELRTGFWSIAGAVRAHVQRYGPVSHVFVLPFFATGGAETVALNFARAAVASGRGSAMVIAADMTLSGVRKLDPPSGVSMLDLSSFFPGADYPQREAILLHVLRLCAARTVHIINSEVGWQLLIRVPQRVRQDHKVFGSIFAFQYDWATGQRVGYAETYLRAVLPHVDGMLTDNARFVAQAIEAYGLATQRDRFHVVYNPLRHGAQVGCDASAAEAAARARIEASQAGSGRLQVVWAGRLDAEKRPELLLDVASTNPDMDFHVFGEVVVDGQLRQSFEGLDNLKWHGPFSRPAEVFEVVDAHAFMFTSRWEGMPNVLLEFGALGLPIVAATVGGVGELISEETGYPVPERPTAEDYSAGLRAIWRHPDEAARRVKALTMLIATRHSEAAFQARVASVPGYLD